MRLRAPFDIDVERMIGNVVLVEDIDKMAVIQGKQNGKDNDTTRFRSEQVRRLYLGELGALDLLVDGDKESDSMGTGGSRLHPSRDLFAEVEDLTLEVRALPVMFQLVLKLSEDIVLFGL